MVVTSSDDDPDGFVVYSFASDDWRACRGYATPTSPVALATTGAEARRAGSTGPSVAEQPLICGRYLTPPPSMPPGHVYADLLQAGKRPSGGKQDFCWLIFERGHSGSWGGYWLHRDGDDA
jgi:hypothetical protein